MNEQLSHFMQAFRAMLVHRAQGRQHDEIAALFSLPRPDGFPESDWVNAIHVLVYGPRGHPTAVFRFVEMALRRYDEQKTISTNTAFPNRIFGSFTSNHLGRLFRHEGSLYRTREKAAGDLSWIEVEAVTPTAPWRAAEFTETKNQIVRFLPFRVREATGGPRMSGTVPEMPIGFPADPQALSMGYTRGTGVLYEILLVPSAVSLLVPPTYLRSDASPRTTDPLGGHLCPDPDFAGSRAFPLYLDSGRRFRQLEGVLTDVLAAGVKAEIKLEGW